MCTARDRIIAELLVGMVINFFIYLITIVPPSPAAMVPPTRPSIEFHIVPAWESLVGRERRKEEKRKGKSGSSELGPIKKKKSCRDSSLLTCPVAFVVVFPVVFFTFFRNYS